MKIEGRKIALNAYEKDYVKLMKNSIFCKTLEIVRGCKEIELVVHTKMRMKKIVAKPNFHRVNI